MRSPVKSTKAALTHAARIGALLRWLGPWADAGARPAIEPLRGEHPVRHLLWQARGKPQASILLLPGLHFLGPDDARFQRFASVLASSGADVVAPYLSDFLSLVLAPRLFDEAAAALVLASERARGPVGVMSISFGSITALHLAATLPERVSSLILFGGYRHLEHTFRFALGAAGGGLPAEVRDPLNGPAVMANLADELLPEAERAPFRRVALEFSRRTWSGRSKNGAHEDKRDGRHLREGAALCDELSGDARALFRIASRLEGDPLAVAEEALPRARERITFLDPGPLLARVRAPVTCVHGRDDDVIPWSEAEALAHDLPNARALVTGLYGHTGNAGGATRPGLAAKLHEVRTMLRVVDALARLGS